MPLMNIRSRKRELRSKYKRVRASMPKELKAQLDQKLTEKFLELDEYKNCGTLFAFVSSEIECDTSKIIGHALGSGRRVAVPKCQKQNGEMDFYYIKSYDDLEEGMFGILEPVPEKCELAADYSNGLCLVPGLSFDLEGYRLGFGKGYYDRFLQKFRGATASVCYNKCIEKELPHGAFDRTVDIIVTEKFINRRAIKE